MHMGYRQVRRLVFDNYQTCIDDISKHFDHRHTLFEYRCLALRKTHLSRDYRLRQCFHGDGDYDDGGDYVGLLYQFEDAYWPMPPLIMTSQPERPPADSQRLQTASLTKRNGRNYNHW